MMDGDGAQSSEDHLWAITVAASPLLMAPTLFLPLPLLRVSQVSSWVI